MPLIAYNINLATDRLDVAKKIAAAIRHSSGGFRFVKAMGIALEDRGIVQVSMNLTNYEKTPIFRVFETVQARGRALRRGVLESEIVGLVPAAALTRSGRVLPAARRLQRRIRCSRTSCEHARSAKSEGSVDSVDSASTSLRLLVRPARRRDAERAHLPIEVAALDAEDVGGARHVALLRGQRAQDVVALELVARLVQRRRSAGAVGGRGARPRRRIEERRGRAPRSRRPAP